jgi:hypothetical protein
MLDRRLQRLQAAARRYWGDGDRGACGQLEHVFQSSQQLSQLICKTRDYNGTLYLEWQAPWSNGKDGQAILTFVSEMPSLLLRPPRYALARAMDDRLLGAFHRKSLSSAMITGSDRDDRFQCRLECNSLIDRVLWRPQFIEIVHSSGLTARVNPFTDGKPAAWNPVTVETGGGWVLTMSTQAFRDTSGRQEVFLSEPVVGPEEEIALIVACILAVVATRDTWSMSAQSKVGD